MAKTDSLQGSLDLLVLKALGMSKDIDALAGSDSLD